MIEVRTKMQKLQLECHRCRQKNVLQGPIECHAKGQGLQTQRPADVADRLIRRISHFHAAIPQANRFLLQGSIAAIPQMQVRQAVWQASRTRGQRKQAAGTQCRKPTGQRKDGKRQPPTLKSLPKQNLTAAASCVCTG